MKQYEKIGIIGAMDVEIKKITEALSSLSSLNIGGSTFFSGKLGSREVVAVQSGIGKVNAAFATTILISHFGVNAIIMTGIAGGISSDIKPLDAFVAKSFIQHDVDILGEKRGFLDILNCVELFADEGLAAKLLCYSNGVSGTMSTGEQFVSSKEQISAILSAFPDVKAVDMEAGAVAQIAARLNIPFACIKVISDDGSSDVYYDFKEVASNKAIAAVLKTLSSL